MTSNKPTEWGGAADAELAPVMRVVDFVLIYAALWLPTYARGEAWDQKDWTAATIAAVLFMVIGQSLRIYQSTREMRLKPQLVRIWGGWVVGVVPILLFLLFISKRSEEYSRFSVSTWFVLAPLLVSVWRTATTLTLRELRAHGYNTRAAAIVGMTELGERLALQFKGVPSLGLEVHGFYDDRGEERCHPIPESLGQRAGDLADAVDAARAGEIDLIYIAFPLRAEPRIAELLRQLSDTTASVYLAADFFAYDLLHARWGTLGGVPTVSLHETPFYGVDGWLKRLEDIVIGTLILITIAIPMLVIGICVKLTSPGPALFRQRRYGLNGEVINVLKFRSMTVTEDGPEIKQATAGDARITKLGAFLRRTNLDELPQFFNVLEGSMSIVGPRPHAVAHNELYRKRIQGYMLRHKVKPGITGWAQVNGWRGETDTLDKMEKRIEHDLDYIRNWSLLWDIQIISMTVFGSGARRNAY
ncbi:MAG: undecaprenyl-phosphate glucose phosphotransferase [Myxococcales bacterium]|nr:undecaprenyl-phosphate glucose phosphotransferase [Myxococcales bacterium]NNK09310.1 undecaprenyl-phosphate glucose phosphotransferase [Myxococcales bacterium]NNK43560.1 undecaprenyl-phosphate glucose phosphotransferase [Myxococcales bacterium]NNL26487.1 undecaprenyl-phosphate glucose phosphotransferase [Myxococcales bacterium]RZV53206.1 MAG: undecaprenyl-phosphate glucose phosphotransferase [Deltaproteobacteria bacterium]